MLQNEYLTKFTTNFNGDSSDDTWHHNDRALFADQQNTGKIISCSTIVMSISLFISSNSALVLFLPSLLFFSPVSPPLDAKEVGLEESYCQGQKGRPQGLQKGCVVVKSYFIYP